jgi:hypothetical protein
MVITVNNKDTGSAGSAKRADERHWSRTLGGVAAVITVAVFSFGAGNLADLTHRLFGPDQEVVHSTNLLKYGNGVEAACTRARDRPAQTLMTVAWMNSLIDQRTDFLTNWSLHSDQNLLGNAEQIDVDVAQEHFEAATGYLGAVASDFGANDRSAYNAHLGDYHQEMAEYMTIIRKLDPYTFCAVNWPAPSTLGS